MPFPNWTTNPIPNVSLSAGGLLALADLDTTAQRTAIAGGSSWLDSIILVPGLHYNQAADQLQNSHGAPFPRSGIAPTGLLSAVETLRSGESMSFPVVNTAMAAYIRRIARPGQTVTLDVGSLPNKGAAMSFWLQRSKSGRHATLFAEGEHGQHLGWLSQVLYLCSPVLTIVAFTFLVLLRDWWSLACLCGLMLSRVLNIWVIKQRAKVAAPRHLHPPHLRSSSAQPTNPSSPEDYNRPAHGLTEYLISLDSTLTGSEPCRIRLRGTRDDLAAVTTRAWLRAKTHVEGYMIAAAKLTVYLVASLSGNMTQAGAIIFMGLLLVSAGLLALSNAHATELRVNGRVAAVSGGHGKGPATEEIKPDGPWPVTQDETAAHGGGSPGSGAGGDGQGMNDLAGRGQAGENGNA